ncbi:MCE family protein [Streptomyces sp. NPDC001843]|uniref:MCE family protein n=1 Tax=Streptomyces sp. NPDC001843 TaxID=3364617 RepID=UPI0036935B2A
MNLRRKGGSIVWAAAGSLLLSGCAFNGWYDIPLPGGAADDGHAYHVTVEFRDVLDLVPQSAVKVDDVTVGAVEKVQLDGWHARVRLRIADSVKLPANAVAELRQTSLLGEKYVALAAPAGTAAVGRLQDGDRIPLSRSGRNPEVEEVLSALSALLNGGGVAQLKTITVELNKALDGRENRVRSLLKELDTFIGSLDDQRRDIVHAIEAVDRLAGRLGKEKKTIAEAVDTMPPALKVLAGQRRDLTKMLTALGKLGKTGTQVVTASHDDTVADLEQLRPILQQLNKAGSDLPNSLELLTTYPFPRNAADAVKGDYVNLHITADLDLSDLYGNLASGDSGKGKGGSKKPGAPGVPDLPGVPHLPSVPTPSALPSTPSLPSAPSVPSAPSGGGPSGPLCPPVCTSAYTTGARPPEGIDLALAELMLKGVQP